MPASQIFVNLPVKDLNKSIEFFTKLGFTFNPQYTDETATCMIISDTIYCMLLTEAKFKEFTPKAICNTQTHVEVINCLALGSRAECDEMVAKAGASGGIPSAKAEDHGFMYQHGFQDIDGHHWEVVYMEPPAAG